MDEAQPNNQIARQALAQWQIEIHQNIYNHDKDFIHTIKYYFPDNFFEINKELEKFGEIVPNQLELAVTENHNTLNLPRLDTYNSIGERIDEIVHHPSYIEAGNIIYSTKLLEKITTPVSMLEGLSLFFLSSQVGEAGHNCPIACSAGIIRVLQKTPDFPNKSFYLKKLIAPSYQTNFTGAQFLTEIQGGSDVGQNAVYAIKNKNSFWRIYGEKWFCSNANADLIFITARFDKNISGTKGLGLFLIPASWENKKNHYSPRRLKDKFGTRTMATAEIDFEGAYAIPMGNLEDGFRLVMENVLHLSRLLNSFTVVSMARRAYTIAHAYAKHRIAFAHPIIDYALVKENLARIKAENSALLAGIFATAKLQSRFDSDKTSDHSMQLILRLLVNIQKYLTAKWSVEHVHHCLDVLAGNGMIETFSSIPRLFRDCIVCENWEGTHNTLMMQVLKDIEKYKIDELYFTYMRQELLLLDKNQNQYKQLIENNLQELEQDILIFHKLDEILKALQIKIIVNRMAIIFVALQLLLEAIDQKEKTGSLSKMYCFQYFYQLHLENKQKSYDKNYLTLIEAILN